MYNAHDWMSDVVNTILGVIMIALLHAMYQRSRKVLVFLVVIFLIIRIANAAMTAIMMMQVAADEFILSSTYQCVFHYTGEFLFLDSITWILGAVWEVLLLCLAEHIFVAIPCFHIGFLKTHSADRHSLKSQIYIGLDQIFQIVQMFVLGPRLILGVREYHAGLTANSDTATAMTSIGFQERVHVSTSSSV
ncbi:hypothetical protein BDR03DRAFT_967885 [Suillus americanus]|nr:hypothetical protein BDR03DRAFT_967885 [Suillus americanus]